MNRIKELPEDKRIEQNPVGVKTV